MITWDSKKDLKRKGYTISKLPVKDFHKIFPNRTDVKKGMHKITIFYRGNKMYLREEDRFFIKILIALSFPISLLLNGLSTAKQNFKQHKRYIFTEKYRSVAAMEIPESMQGEIKRALK